MELTDTERAVLAHLAAAWNMYLRLSKAHPDQDAEFRHGIRALQHQIMARPTRRMLLAEAEAPKVCECGPLRNITNGGHFPACTRCKRRLKP